VHAARHDSHGFTAGELERRRALRYPPYSHLIRIVCSAETAEQARAAAGAVRASLEQRLECVGSRGSATDPTSAAPAAIPGRRSYAGESATVLGPAALFRLRGRERSVLVVKAGHRSQAVQAVGEAVQTVAGGRTHAGVNFSVDVDPQ
jgi:primosomal protein N' (replication factor Y)